MTFDQLVDHYGTIAKISAAVAPTWPATEQAIGQWRKAGIPEGRQFQFELLTGGALKAEKPEAA
jgi:hypothetical protein